MSCDDLFLSDFADLGNNEPFGSHGLLHEGPNERLVDTKEGIRPEYVPAAGSVVHASKMMFNEATSKYPSTQSFLGEMQFKYRIARSNKSKDAQV